MKLMLLYCGYTSLEMEAQNGPYERVMDGGFKPFGRLVTFLELGIQVYPSWIHLSFATRVGGF